VSEPNDPAEASGQQPREQQPSSPLPPAPYGQPGYAGPPGYPPNYPPAYTPGFAAPGVEYAHWGLRVGSYLLDALLLVPFYIVAVAAVAVAGTDANGDPQVAGVTVMIVVYVAALVFGIWNQIVRQGRTGQSLGKQWVGTRLLREDNGTPLGGWLTFGRALLHVLDGLPCYIGYLWPLWDAKRQTFADKIVKSVVVRRLPAFPGSPPHPPSASTTWTPGPPPGAPGSFRPGS
jgi:uncharacterized RDD family membrane protein YckC